MRKLLTILLFTAVFLAPSFAQSNSARMLSGVNAQTGTSYTLQASDVTKLVTFNNTAATAVTLPSGTTVGFGIGTIFAVRNLGSGPVTITCSSCLIYAASGAGASTLVLSQAQGADIFGDGTNFAAQTSGVSSFTSPLTTKGDLFTHGGADARLPVGTDGQVVTADSTQTLGVKWANGTTSPLTTKGDLFGFSSVNARIPVGLDGQQLTADSTKANGIAWSSGLTRFNATTYGATFNTQVCTSAGISNGSTTIVCPTATFVNSASPTGDIGKIVWVMDNAVNVLSVPQGTITNVTDATHIVVSLAATRNLTVPNTGLMVWGTDDDAALNTAWTTTAASCQTLYLPQGIALVSTAKFNSYSGCTASGNYQQPGVHGTDKGATFLVPVPNFNFAGCTPACFMGGIFSIVGHFSVWGTGYSPAGGAGQTLAENNSGFFTDMDFSDWCNTCANSIGVKFVGPGAEAQFGGSEYFGTTALQMNGVATGPQGLINFVGFGSSVGVEVVTGTAWSIGNTFGGQVNTILVDAGATLDSRDEAIYPSSILGGGPISVAGRLNVDHLLTGGFSPTIIQASGTVTARNTPFLTTNADTSFPVNGTHVYNGSWLIQNPGGVFQDQGGNSYAGTAYTVNPPIYRQTNSARTSGSGTTTGISFPINTAGSSVFVIMSWVGSAVASSSVTDTQGNTYIQLGSDQTTTATYGIARRAALYYTKITASSGADTITCTTAGAVTFLLCAPNEFSNQNQTTTVDNFNAVTFSAGTAFSEAAAHSTTTANDMVVLFFANDTGATYNPVSFAGISVIPGGMPMTSPAPVGTATYTVTYGPITPASVTYSFAGFMSQNSDAVGWSVQIRTAGTDNTASSIAGSSSINGSATASSNYVLSGGWGNTPAATIVLAKNPTTGNTRYTITAGTAALGANPTVTFTYPTAFPLAPTCSMRQDGGTQAAVANPFTVGTPTATSVVFTYTGTPGSGNTLTGTVSCQ